MYPPYDILIVGCGMSGGLAALTALKKGLSVCVIEQRKRHLIGKKCCGELLPQEVLFWMKKKFNIPIAYYPIPKLQICTQEEHIRSSPSPSGIIINQRLCTIDRYDFQQKMVKEILRRGGVLHQGTVTAPVGYTHIEGVRTKESHTILGKIVIDCSGVASALSDYIAFAGLQPEQVMGLAYKETLTLKEPQEGGIASIIFDLSVGFSQYMWCFPKAPRDFNVGIGGLGASRADLFYRFKSMLQSHPFEITNRTDRGFGLLPLNGPLPCAVGPGLLLCGDAAGHVNPLTGEGIAPAIQAGYYAGTVAADAIENNDYSVKALWPYNSQIARKTGIMHMSFLLLREFFRSLGPDQLQFLLGTILSGDILEQLENDTLTGIQKFCIALRSLKKPDILVPLVSLSRTMEKLKLLYDTYPSHVDGFPSWFMALQSLRHLHGKPKIFSSS